MILFDASKLRLVRVHADLTREPKNLFVYVHAVFWLSRSEWTASPSPAVGAPTRSDGKALTP